MAREAKDVAARRDRDVSQRQPQQHEAQDESWDGQPMSPRRSTRSVRRLVHLRSGLFRHVPPRIRNDPRRPTAIVRSLSCGSGHHNQGQRELR
jgi:hypothetical protein